MRLALLALALAACGVHTPPSADECTEFDHATIHNGKSATCRMLWCVRVVGDSFTSGAATLWCEP